MAKNLTNFQKRCEDCACLVVQNGKWLCDECFSCPIEEVDECPESITLEEVQEIEDKTKGVKIDHGAKSDKPKEKKPKTVKISNEKTEIFEYLTDFCLNSTTLP